MKIQNLVQISETEWAAAQAMYAAKAVGKDRVVLAGSVLVASD